MYGYVRAHSPELKVREQEYYRAIYCGLCRTMGKCTGQCSRLTLSYDFTFFALLRLALEDKEVEITARHCALHPIKKRSMATPNDTLAFCAGASALLAYHKLYDDRKDETGGRRFKAIMATPYVKRLRRKAIKAGYKDLDAKIMARMRTLSSLEATRPASVDRPAELFGDVMAELLSHGLEGEAKRLGHELGRRLGRWIYLIDAIDDFEEDQSKGRYNPFVCLWKDGEITAQRREDLQNALLSELVAVENALDLLDPGDTENSNLWGVVRNILYLGMPATAHRVVFPDCTCHQCQKNNANKKTKGNKTS